MHLKKNNKGKHFLTLIWTGGGGGCSRLLIKGMMRVKCADFL